MRLEWNTWTRGIGSRTCDLLRAKLAEEDATPTPAVLPHSSGSALRTLGYTRSQIATGVQKEPVWNQNMDLYKKININI